MGQDSVFRVVSQGIVNNNVWVNTLYFKQLSAAGDPGGLMDAIDSTIYQALEAYNPANWGLKLITMSELVIGGGAQFQQTSATAGTDATGNGDITASMVASYRTGIAGRSHRGRNYFSVTSEDFLTAGVFEVAASTALKNALDAFLAIYGANGTNADYTWGVWSRKLGETLDANGHVTAYNLAAGFFPVTEVKVDQVIRTQRRRQFGKGV